MSLLLWSKNGGKKSCLLYPSVQRGGYFQGTIIQRYLPGYGTKTHAAVFSIYIVTRPETSSSPGLMARNTVHCSMCGKAFFPGSLPIHQKACAQKMALVEVPCLYCRELHPHGEMASHHSKCKAAKQVLRARGGAAATTVSSVDQSGNSLSSKVCPSGGQGTGSFAVNTHAGLPTASADSSLSGQAMACGVCNRKFSIDRIAVHQVSLNDLLERFLSSIFKL